MDSGENRIEDGESKLEREVCYFKVLRVGDDEKMNGREMVKVEIINGPKNCHLNGDVWDFDKKWAGKEFKMPLSDYKEIVGENPKVGESVSYNIDRLLVYLKSQVDRMKSERFSQDIADGFSRQDLEDSSLGIDYSELEG